MSVLKCKMCGGDLNIVEGQSVCECEYCGSKQTVTSNKDEEMQALFNRANILRMKAEFDRAAEIYEKILQKSDTESEAYWGLILCKYGIEYVEDPNTLKRIPTCHRTSYDAVTTDDDYKNAIKYADAIQKGIYEDEAKAIDQIQKGILALAQQEAPYDVFICYKETDENGERTKESVIANDIYYQLTQEGFKVFYAAVSLESHLGSEYEPYIFSALNTSKVMLAIGTKPEYFNAVWVKNEWSRFLKILKNDRSKLLIPCYKNMDPYELPEEFAHLQAQDMGKIGFINDIVRGIKKIIVKEPESKTAPEVVLRESIGNTTALAQIKRGNMALEDQEWEKADSFFEEALNIDPECAEAYIGKLLVRDKKAGLASWVNYQKNKFSSADSKLLRACEKDRNHIDNIVKEYAIREFLVGDTIREQYSFDLDFSSFLACRQEQKNQQLSELKNDRLLNRAIQYAKGATKTQIDDMLSEVTSVLDQRIKEAEAQDTESINKIKENYADFLKSTDEKIKNLNQDAQKKREEYYQQALLDMNSAKDVEGYNRLVAKFECLDGYKDSKELLAKCKAEIARLKEAMRLEEERKAEKERLEAERKAEEERKAAKKRKTIGAISAVIICVVAAVAVLFINVIQPKQKYNKAMSLLDSGEYDAAYTLLEELGENETIASSKYDRALNLMDSGDYESAYMLLNGLSYKDSEDKLNSIRPQCKQILLSKANVGDKILFGTYEQDNNISNGKEDIEWQVLARENNKILVISTCALDCQPYNTLYGDVTWESCSLRKWMNDTFLKAAFTVEEQTQIIDSTVSADKNPKYSTDPGNATTDKVFLLSINEVEKYFNSDEARQCAPTAYAEANGAWRSSTHKTTSGEATCWWWLRSPGFSQINAAYVNYDGSVYAYGLYVDYSHICVRPALWISL